MTNKKEISIIIPIYNESQTLEALLENLEQFKDQAQIIFVDGGSQDDTCKKLEEDHYLIRAEKKGRANQMNEGARLSQGDILLFLHADSRLEAGALDEVRTIIDRGYQVGCFSIKFDSKSPLMWICGHMSSLRVRLRNIAFGDQGIFIRRDFFDQLGGFEAIPLMEDYQLSMDIKKKGQKIVLAKTRIWTSERRFKENGRLKTMAKMQRLQHLYRRGMDAESLAKEYR